MPVKFDNQLKPTVLPTNQPDQPKKYNFMDVLNDPDAREIYEIVEGRSRKHKLADRTAAIQRLKDQYGYDDPISYDIYDPDQPLRQRRAELQKEFNGVTINDIIDALEYSIKSTPEPITDEEKYNDTRYRQTLNKYDGIASAIVKALRQRKGMK